MWSRSPLVTHVCADVEEVDLPAVCSGRSGADSFGQHFERGRYLGHMHMQSCTLYCTTVICITLTRCRVHASRTTPVCNTNAPYLDSVFTTLTSTRSCLLLKRLRQIWDLSDADNDTKLSMGEFCVGMHLIVCASKKGLAIPATVPRSLAIAGTASSLVTNPAPSLGGSSGTPVLQSPVMRPSPAVQTLSTPPAGHGFSSLGAMSAADPGDAFRQV